MVSLPPTPFRPEDPREGWVVARLSTTVQPPTQDPLPAGIHLLGPDPKAPALLVPEAVPDGPVGLVLLLHGATMNAQQTVPILEEQAEAGRFLVLVPKSRRSTWDVIRERAYGPDVATIDGALANVVDHFPVDPTRLAVAGISDGASYALSLGLTNGDLFSHVIAWSPGFAAPGPIHGRPPIFISHGVDDWVLPIDGTSRQLVPALRHAGYEVDYREFDGGHTIPRPLATESVAPIAHPAG